MRLKLLIFFSLMALAASGQSYNKIKFGDVTEKDFATKVYTIDSSASAVIISDIGTSRIEGGGKGGFALIYKRHRRVHILNKNGYDLSNVSISVYAGDDGEEEKLEKLRGVTYNFENGKVVESKLDVKSGLLKDKIDKNWGVRKFSPGNTRGLIHVSGASTIFHSPIF
jgi:hypothetical protein